MAIQHVITKVLKKRHQNVPMLEQTERALHELTQQLDTLRHMAGDTTELENVPEDFREVTANIGNQIGSLQQEIADLLPKVANVAERFRKDTINIGVAGRAKQGKSTILQSISGLPKELIPTREDAACTATKSKIYHFEGEAYAHIDFYAADEFLKEMVVPSFKQLRLPPPFSLRDFQNPLPPLNVEESQERLLDKEIYDQLSKLQQAFPAFHQELSTSKTIQIADIPHYVTKDHAVSMGIKAAHIYTRFPNHDVTGLCLIDLPGMEAGYNFEAKLIDSLEKEVDAVIYVKRPNPKEGVWDKIDYNILDLINASVKDIQLEQWLFIVLNELDDGSNSSAVQYLQAHVPANYTQLNMLTCMCKDSADVERSIFAPILDHLEQNLEEIDRALLTNLSSHMEQIAGKATLSLSQVMKFFHAEADELGVFKTFKRCFEEFHQKLANTLENLVVEVRTRTYLDENQQNFLATVKAICREAEENPPVPSVEELKNRFYPEGGWFGIVEETLPNLRTELAESLAEGLNVFLEDMIENIYRDILVEAIPEKLRALVASDDKKLTPREQMEAFYELLDPHEHPKLRGAFKYIFGFDFSYQSHFHYRVRQQMKSLDPLMDASLVPDLIPSNAGKEQAEDIQRGLATMYAQAVAKIQKQFITEMQADPGNAVFALVEEIRDRLLRKEGVIDEWETFLLLRRGEVWPEEFSRFDQQTKLRKQWQGALESVLTSCRALQQGFRP